MFTSKYLLSTNKKNSSDNEIISYQLMLRAGIIRKLSSGLYIWLPTGIRILKKIENIIRKEMNSIGALEILMPIVQPADLWKKSNRWEKYGPELLKIKDRHNRLCVLGPTHEEVITDLISNELHSYKQLPLNLYQIQTKFRDEIRSRFGVIRSREFIMKDAYSFHLCQDSLEKTYDVMYTSYCKIFNQMRLNFRVVQADTGSIGGNISHEFQVIANNGENRIVFSDKSIYASNIDCAEVYIPKDKLALPTQQLLKIDIPNGESILYLINFLHIPIKKIIKTIIVKAKKESGYKFFALLIRADHEINEKKVEKLDLVNSPLIFASEEEIRFITGTEPKSIGPIDLKIPIIVDHTVSNMSDFTAGANVDGKYYTGINWGRDLQLTNIADIRNVVSGDLSPDGQGILHVTHSIEIGHIFQLGTKYSDIIKACVQTEDCTNKNILMGCYGIGVTRIIAAVIEQNHDKYGIIWPTSLSPFEMAIIPINMYSSTIVKKTVENIYNQLIIKKVDVILDDRKETPGVMFADIELIGIPYVIIISERNLKNNDIEYKVRSTGEKKMIKCNKIIDFLLNILKK
ncbi:proline--tRNA ligase [Candidatus Pantoea edessiphila]|uniref:Proline--tRNA ligase n=1 Tax=Candidatus Pantoea edessiphila TaxID=2044610 RepID=A0A2P5SXZ2_9GAMM|nr:proline--tRNA ligase [Candidatus Pantoea edessiphila]MBK4775555.1 proline--tRNA ligase [Pantoea sp. Edef]PPI87208.1 proline--tRNA ligase [Candidatus Pantoea edessiphila]